MRTSILCLLALGMLACGKDAEKIIDDLPKKEFADPQFCEPFIPTGGKEETVPNPVKPTSCCVVVMFCNLCKYDADGQFIEEDTEACGICFGAEHDVGGGGQ